MAYLGRKGAVAPLTSGDIPDGVIEGRDIAFFENGSGQDLSGTYSTERMYLAGRTGSAPNDYNYKLVGNIDVTGHLALGTIADDDVIITQDSTERTITGSGTLESGRLANDPTTSLTGMTGELGSAVNLNSAYLKHFPRKQCLSLQQSLLVCQQRLRVLLLLCDLSNSLCNLQKAHYYIRTTSGI